jgi:hypothetical protein
MQDFRPYRAEPGRPPIQFNNYFCNLYGTFLAEFAYC